MSRGRQFPASARRESQNQDVRRRRFSATRPCRSAPLLPRNRPPQEAFADISVCSVHHLQPEFSLYQPLFILIYPGEALSLEQLLSSTPHSWAVKMKMCFRVPLRYPPTLFRDGPGSIAL